MHNPISGRGRASAFAETLCTALEAAGHDVRSCPTRPADPADWLDPAARTADAMIVAGGDGAVRMVAGSAARTGAAVYHAPFGTENLFARGFGMTRDPDAILAAIDAGRVERVDAARVSPRETNGAAESGVRFVLMVSLGFDAAVVHDLSARRTGRISHLSYALPIARQLFQWRSPAFTVRVDGETIVDQAPGLVLVGNAPYYMRGLNPAGRARMDDGLLDAVFLPARSSFAFVRWAIACARRRQLDHPRVPYRQGHVIDIDADAPAPVQIDGDEPHESAVRVAQNLRVTVERGELPVLLPAG